MPSHINGTSTAPEEKSLGTKLGCLQSWTVINWKCLLCDEIRKQVKGEFELLSSWNSTSIKNGKTFKTKATITITAETFLRLPNIHSVNVRWYSGCPCWYFSANNGSFQSGVFLLNLQHDTSPEVVKGLHGRQHRNRKSCPSRKYQDTHTKCSFLFFAPHLHSEQPAWRAVIKNWQQTRGHLLRWGAVRWEPLQEMQSVA